MAVLIALTIPILWLLPQPNKNPYRPSIDLPSVAYEAGQEAGYPVAAAEQEGWHYNFGRWNTGNSDGINYWQTGQVTPNEHFIELTQAAGTNSTWISNVVDNAAISGEEEIAGHTWQVRSLTTKEKAEVISYVGEIDSTTVIISGQADQAELKQFVQATVDYLNQPTYTTAPTQGPSSGIQ